MQVVPVQHVSIVRLWRVPVVCTGGMNHYCVLVVCSIALHQWRVPVVCTSVPVVCTSVPVVCTSVPIVCTSGVYQ